MKGVIVLLVIWLFTNFSLHGQTWEEWTQQKKTAIQRLLEQVYANKVYIGYARQGYRIASGGLQAIRQIKAGDYRLHLGFIDSLKVVNPKIKDWTKVPAIISHQLQIIKSCKQALDLVRESGQFTPSETEYCKIVFDNLLAECLHTIDQLLLVIADGEQSMNDTERIKRIEFFYLDMQEKSSFAASFCNEMSVLALQRLTEQGEIDYSRKIQGYR